MPDFNIDSPPLGQQRDWMRTLTPSGPPPWATERVAPARPSWVRPEPDVAPAPPPEAEEPLAQEEPGASEPDEPDDAEALKAEAADAAGPESEAAAAPDPEPAGEQPQTDTTSGSASDAPRRERYVKTDDIERAVKGRGADVLRAIGVQWHGGHDHIRCPLRLHEDKDPSWRWDEEKECCFCTCEAKGWSIFKIVMRIEGIDFGTAKIRVAEIINRHDLIIEPDASPGVTLAEIAEAKRLPIEFLRKMGWFDLPRRGQNHDRSAVGIRYSDGNREWLRIRTARGGDTKKKFRWKKGDKEAPLYRAHQVEEMRSAGYVFVVGGESCTATMLFHNYPALGLPGEGCWNEARHAPLLDGFPKIYVVVEPDQGGQRVQEWVARSSIRSRVMFIFMTPAAKDMSALYLADPAGFETTVRALMATAVPFDQEKHAPPKSESAQGETRSRRSHDDAPAGGLVSPRGLPVIEYAGGKLAEATDKAERILAEADPEIYQRSDFLVRLGTAEDMTAADGEKIKGPRLVTVGAMHLQDRMNRVIEFMKFDEKLEDYKPINPPRDVAEALRQRIGLWKYIPVIDGIASAPIFRADGTILDQPGFDPATHIYYAPTPGVVFWPIPPEPTKEEARVALDTLCDLIGEFPFIQENGDPATGQPSPSRSVALSGLITPMVRRAILSAPIHGFDATEAGSGKSKLCSMPSIIIRGHAAPVIPGGTALNPEEFEKKISTSLIGADAIVVVDNVEGRISSELLCSAATERMLYIRVLGLSKHILVPNGSTFYINGNALTIVGDLVRRSLRAGLDPKVDRPELRTFEKPDPVLRAMRDRPMYVAAILTILRAFHVAGRPKQTEPLGSFEDWSRLVRDALIWLGEPDPCATMERTRKQDPRRKSLADILYWWDAIIGRGEVTAKRVIEYAEERDPGDYDSPAMTLRYPEFREALMAVAAGKTGSVDPVRFGQWLGRNAMRFVDGLRIEPGLAVDHSGSSRWKAVPA